MRDQLVPLFRQIVVSGTFASLDIAGAAVFPPPAWPILKAALQPVLDRLKERLGGKDVTSSKELAEKAADEFESDRHLQELLQSGLLERLDALASGQQSIDAGVQKLMVVVSGNQQQLQEIVGGVEAVSKRLDSGVNLSPEALDQIRQMLSQQADNSRQVRRLALRDMGPIGQLLEDQVGRLQVRADELIQSNDVDRALDELRAGVTLVAALLVEAPTDVFLRLQLAYIYKTFAQVFDAANMPTEANQYTDKAAEVLRLAQEDLSGDQHSLAEVANAVHVNGNILQQRGDFRGAIEKYRVATTLMPGHCYAWHDIISCYYELNQREQPVDVAEMRRALEMVRECTGQPGLGGQYIATLEQAVDQIEKDFTTRAAASRAAP